MITFRPLLRRLLGDWRVLLGLGVIGVLIGALVEAIDG